MRMRSCRCTLLRGRPACSLRPAAFERAAQRVFAIGPAAPGTFSRQLSDAQPQLSRAQPDEDRAVCAAPQRGGTRVARSPLRALTLTTLRKCRVWRPLQPAVPREPVCFARSAETCRRPWQKRRKRVCRAAPCSRFAFRCARSTAARAWRARPSRAQVSKRTLQVCFACGTWPRARRGGVSGRDQLRLTELASCLQAAHLGSSLAKPKAPKRGRRVTEPPCRRGSPRAARRSPPTGWPPS